MADDVLRPQPPHEGNGLVERGDAVDCRKELVAVCLVLALVPAGAEPEDEPAVREDVDARRFLRQQPDVAIPHACDELAEANRRGHLRERGQRGERLEHVRRFASRHRLEMVVHPQVVVPEPFRELRDLDRSLPGAARRPAGVLEFPTLRRKDAVAQRVSQEAASAGCLKFQYCTSIVIGSKYFT